MKRGAVQNDRGANGQDKLGYARVNLVLVVHAAEGEWEGRRPLRRWRKRSSRPGGPPELEDSFGQRRVVAG